MDKQLDIIIFGATGFTGKHAILEGIKILEKYSWGIAGRSTEKLEAVLKEIGTRAETDLSKIPKIIANIEDPDSLTKMAESAKVNILAIYIVYR